MSSPHAGAALRRLMQKECVSMPGAFNGLVARMIAEVGFKGLYVSGAAVTASKGTPDIGLTGLEGFSQVIQEVTSVSGLPCIADADTGFGEDEMIVKTVHEYARHGAAGLHIEDQVFPKRCGHLDGKTLVSSASFSKKIQLAKEASKACSPPNGDFIICARTDARGVEGFDAAVSRATQYVDAGADMIFPEGLASLEEFTQFAKHMRQLKGEAPQGGPYLLANMTEFGKTPYLHLQQFAEAGYHCVIYPVSMLRIAAKAARQGLEILKEKETLEGQGVDMMYTRQQLYNTLQYTPGKEWIYPSPTYKGGGHK